ncbi:MAG TPA: MBL fold metallo-hydrolase [Bacteroidia bacterium]|nr:MBL fold metallo-hydrolase [Bacteroidia bacterium]
MQLKSFTFGPFYENTYVLWDETRECVIIDPGCYTDEEEDELRDFIRDNGLAPVRLLNTHAHVDHVFGNPFVAKEWNLLPEMHREDLRVLHSFPQVCMLYGLNGKEQPEPEKFLDEGQKITFGKTEMDIFFTPGHSPGSICFYNAKEKILLGGDVLFQGSIGRTDLPGGDFETLMKSIRGKVFQLPPDVRVYSGHGPQTTIGEEKRSNPFVGEG